MDTKPIHKYNGGRGATLCHKCSVIISEGLTDDMLCKSCIEDPDFAEWRKMERSYYYGLRIGKVDRELTVFEWLRQNYHLPKPKNKQDE
jgi:hypothetical protein